MIGASAQAPFPNNRSLSKQQSNKLTVNLCKCLCFSGHLCLQIHTTKVALMMLLLLKPVALKTSAMTSGDFSKPP